MTSSVATRKQRSKVSRTVKVLVPLLKTPSCGVVRVTEGKKVEDYYLARQPADAEGDRGFRLAKLSDPESTYDVLLSGLTYSCECRGFIRWNHCRHGELLTALEANGKV